MGVSVIKEQRDIIVNTIKSITRGDWKVLVIDEASKKIIDNVVKEDDILNENIANIERIENRRDMNPDMDAIYILSPQPHIVDCLMADFERRRYRKSFLVGTRTTGRIRNIIHRLFPSRITFDHLQGPLEFPLLYHPSCNNFVRDHMQLLAQKITGICVTLGEYPKVRYYRPRNPIHEASVLCAHLARFVQEELDAYAQWNRNFPPPAGRPQGVLVITDRSMDLVAPLIHEFTYQAMAHDLLPIMEGEKVVYKTVVTEGDGAQEEKEMEIGEKDKIWVANRHTHMKDTIEKLMSDFQKFMADNPHFTNEGDPASLNAIKDMLAGLPQFQEMKEAYSLHLTMAQECMNIFQHHKLPDIASVEQSLGTGLDEDFRKPKNLADQLVRLLDDETIELPDRLRLILLYIIYKNGLIPDDTQRLLAHSSLPPQDMEVITNLELLGARTTKAFKDTKPPPQPLFPRKTAPSAADEEYALSRFEPALKLMLDDIVKGTLDQGPFPYTKPPLDNSDELAAQSQASLRSAKPTWARNRMSANENQQRIIVFMAGGATYSEARACYEVSKNAGRDVFLATSHMLTPALFIKQTADLSADRRRLDLPIERPKPKAPAHLFEREAPKPMQTMPKAPNAQLSAGLPMRGGPVSPGPPAPIMKSQAASIPPTAGMANLSMNNGGGEEWPAPSLDKKGKLEKKDKHKDKDGEKKKRGFFGSKKDKNRD